MWRTFKFTLSIDSRVKNHVIIFFDQIIATVHNNSAFSPQFEYEYAPRQHFTVLESMLFLSSSVPYLWPFDIEIEVL